MTSENENILNSIKNEIEDEFNLADKQKKRKE